MMLRAVIGYSSEIEKDEISGKTQQQKMNRVEPVEEVFHFQIAFFSVVEKDGHEGQGSCELILHDEGSGQTLDRTGIADKKQSTDEKNASCTHGSVPEAPALQD